MFTKLQISDLNGIATITRTGGDSLLSVGENANQTPFSALANGFDLRMGIKVSEKQYDKAARNQSNNQTIINRSTLLKKINPSMFGSHSNSSVTEITGKKGEYKIIKGQKRFIPPVLTVEEEIWCSIADWAYSSFGTLRGVTCLISLQNGEKMFKKF